MGHGVAGPACGLNDLHPFEGAINGPYVVHGVEGIWYKVYIMWPFLQVGGA